MKAPIPVNERSRLELLRQYQILDTAAEPAFDEVTARAADLCQTPISLLTFVDRDRAWFKSNTGLELRAIPRDASFCAHAICRDDLFVSEDMLADECFSQKSVGDREAPPAILRRHAAAFAAERTGQRRRPAARNPARRRPPFHASLKGPLCHLPE